jgi:hypothetical protein
MPVMLWFYIITCQIAQRVHHQLKQFKLWQNNINAVCPDLVRAYAFSYLNNTPCSYTAGWVSGNGLSLYSPMDNGANQVLFIL